MKSLWKNKIYTLNKLNLINISALKNIEIDRKELVNNQIDLKVVNRFVSVDLRMKSNNVNVSIYNGKFFFIVKFKENALNKSFKFGELSFTRRIGLIHKEKKKNKQVLKKK